MRSDKPKAITHSKITVAAMFLSLPAATAQSVTPPPGFEITNRLTFKHEQSQALFGKNPVIILWGII